MANANQPSQRTSQPGGIPGTIGDASTPNEDRIVASPEGPERTDGGVNQNATDAFDPHVDGGRRRTGTTAEDATGRTQGDTRPNRQNDGGEMADQAG